MHADTYDDEGIIPHDQFVAQMEREKRTRYAKGTAALVVVGATIVFLAFAITQLAGGSAVFTN